MCAIQTLFYQRKILLKVKGTFKGEKVKKWLRLLKGEKVKGGKGEKMAAPFKGERGKR